MPLTRLLMTVCVLSLALFIAAIDQTIVSTATVRISEEFKALSQAPWLANAYLLSSTALQPSTGKLSDIFGRTQMLLFGLVIFAIGSLVCALAHSMTVLLVGRAVAGIGAASIVGLTLVIVADIVPMRNRGPYMAIFSLVFSVSSVVGPLLGGLLTDRVTWRWIFWLSEPITGFVIVAVLLLLRLPRMGTDMWSKIKRIDYIGIVFLVGGLTSLILGMTFPSTSDFGWKSAKVIACLVLGGVVLIVFFIIEWKVAVDPVVPLRLFCIRNVSSMMAASFFMGACLFIPIYYIPIYYNVVVHTSATIAGIYMLPFVVGIMITSIGSGFLVMKFGRYRPFMWAGTAVCAVGLGLLALLKRDSGMAMRICSILVAGLGVGSFIQLSLIAGQAAVEPKDMASTTAVLTFFRSIGSIFGMAIMQTVMTTKLHDVIDSMLTRYPVYLHPLIRHTINNPSTIYYDYVDSDLRADVIDAYMQALHLVFLATIPFGVLMFLSTLVLEHKELARRLQPTAHDIVTGDEAKQRSQPASQPGAMGNIRRIVSAFLATQPD
ncbi:major facilitator superfamily-domain-containing protein [Coemansia spiralis]|nr:major facilitator superfamily-domain-containing protein [Coemansia spiralis]